MNITIRDMMQLDIFRSMKLIAGESGLDNTVSKVGIWDYEFTKRGDLYNPVGHWIPGEFVLTSLTYARDNTPILIDAAKKLHAEKTSGLAIKNIYSFKIPHELKNFASQHRYPIFIFTDNSLYFESIIIAVHNFTSLINDQEAIERNIMKLLTNEYDGQAVARLSQEICFAMSTKFSIAYFIPKKPLEPQKLNAILTSDRKILGRGNAIVRYHNGFFYIHSGRIDSEREDLNFYIQDIARKTNFNLEDFHIGISETQYFMSNFKKGMLQSYYAAFNSFILDKNISHYDNIGIYKLLLPYKNDTIYQEYYERIIIPLIEYDTKNNTTLLDTALLYEECKGNINTMADRLHTHGNTIRYRIKKAAETIGLDEDSGDFHEQLSIAAKLHRIKRLDHIFNL